MNNVLRVGFLYNKGFFDGLCKSTAHFISMLLYLSLRRVYAATNHYKTIGTVADMDRLECLCDIMDEYIRHSKGFNNRIDVSLTVARVRDGGGFHLSCL